MLSTPDSTGSRGVGVVVLLPPSFPGIGHTGMHPQNNGTPNWLAGPNNGKQGRGCYLCNWIRPGGTEYLFVAGANNGR